MNFKPNKELELYLSDKGFRYDRCATYDSLRYSSNKSTTCFTNGYFEIFFNKKYIQFVERDLLVEERYTSISQTDLDNIISYYTNTEIFPVKIQTSADEIENIMNRYSLDRDSFRSYRPLQLRKAEFQEVIDEVNVAREFLTRVCRAQRPNSDSDYMRRKAERWCTRYCNHVHYHISTGTFIAAAILENFTIKEVDNYNITLNVSKKSFSPLVR